MKWCYERQSVSDIPFMRYHGQVTVTVSNNCIWIVSGSDFILIHVDLAVCPSQSLKDFNPYSKWNKPLAISCWFLLHPRHICIVLGWFPGVAAHASVVPCLPSLMKITCSIADLSHAQSAAASVLPQLLFTHSWLRRHTYPPLRPTVKWSGLLPPWDFLPSLPLCSTKQRATWKQLSSGLHAAECQAYSFPNPGSSLTSPVAQLWRPFKGLGPFCIIDWQQWCLGCRIPLFIPEFCLSPRWGRAWSLPTASGHPKKVSSGLDWVVKTEHWLIFQVQFPAAIWQLASICNSCIMESNALFSLFACSTPTICRQNTHTHNNLK